MFSVIAQLAREYCKKVLQDYEAPALDEKLEADLNRYIESLA